MITFDRCGELLSSEQLAARLQKFEEQPPQKTAFVIGGAEGLDQRVLAASSQQLAFGRITLPHQLARVVVVEQVYRALTIMRGLPYHR